MLKRVRLLHFSRTLAERDLHRLHQVDHVRDTSALFCINRVRIFSLRLCFAYFSHLSFKDFFHRSAERKFMHVLYVFPIFIS
jgi:hypothetical protein